jgi:hypothetical protein
MNSLEITFSGEFKLFPLNKNIKKLCLNLEDYTEDISKFLYLELH